jgi:putative transposase
MPNYPQHLASFDYRGFHRYFLTFCTHRRALHFTSADVVESVLSQILSTASAEGMSLTAYCFVPDHLHLLAEGTMPDADLKSFVTKSKQLSGYHFARRRRARLWQRYGYERVLRAEETTRDVVRYILENPVRAGLAKGVTSYPFWGSEVYSREQLIEYVQAERAG